LITIKLNIISNSNPDYIIEKQKNYSFAFRKLYKHFILDDKMFNKLLMEKYNLSVYEFNCLIIDVQTKINQVKTQKDKLESKIISIEKDIKLLQDNIKSIKNTRKIFKLNKKLSYFNKLLSKDIVFGNKTILQQISYLSNNKLSNNNDILKHKETYKNNRLLSINYIGSKDDKNSNRYFNFDFDNNLIIYKQTNKIKIELKYKVSNNYKKYLNRLQEIKDNKILPISVRLTNKFIYLTIDNQKLNGYDFKQLEYNKKVKGIKDKQIRKDILISFYNEQRERMLQNKLPNRYISIDLNPNYIGCCILDKIYEDNFKIIDKFCFDLSKLNIKSNKNSDDKLSKYLNNKRKYEISIIYKILFNKAKHYKVSHFVIEELNFKQQNINDKSKEVNRLTKNVWNRTYQYNLINKYCLERGIELIEVNPVYSSFIGNILYNYFDPVNSSIEICRRGIIKYIKNSKFYPVLTSTIIDTMINRFKSIGDVQFIKDCESWIELYKNTKSLNFIYRVQLDDVNHQLFSLNNTKSKVNYITF